MRPEGLINIDGKMIIDYGIIKTISINTEYDSHLKEVRTILFYTPTNVDNLYKCLLPDWMFRIDTSIITSLINHTMNNWYEDYYPRSLFDILRMKTSLLCLDKLTQEIHDLAKAYTHYNYYNLDSEWTTLIDTHFTLKNGIQWEYETISYDNKVYWPTKIIGKYDEINIGTMVDYKKSLLEDRDYNFMDIVCESKRIISIYFSIFKQSCLDNNYSEYL